MYLGPLGLYATTCTCLASNGMDLYPASELYFFQSSVMIRPSLRIINRVGWPSIVTFRFVCLPHVCARGRAIVVANRFCLTCVQHDDSWTFSFGVPLRSPMATGL